MHICIKKIMSHGEPLASMHVLAIFNCTIYDFYHEKVLESTTTLILLCHFSALQVLISAQLILEFKNKFRAFLRRRSTQV